MKRKSMMSIMLAALIMITAACGGSGGSSSGNSAAGNTAGNAPAANASAPAAEQSGGLGVTIDEPVTIEFWHAMTGQLETTLQSLADKFHEENPNITVKLVAQGSYSDLSQKLMAAAKAKTSPAMAQGYASWQTEYINNRLIEDLTPYMNDPEVGLSEEDKNDIVPAFLEDNMWDGKLYGLPFNKSTEVLYYNQDYLTHAGVEVPTTWEELKEAAAKLTGSFNGKDVVGMGFENSVTMDLPTFVLQAGGEFVSADGEVLFNSAEGKAALSFLHDMIVTDKTGRLAGEDGYMSTPFGRGDVAMYIGSSAGASYVADSVGGAFSWSTAVLPKNVAAASPFNGTNTFVFTSASAEEKLAAWLFAKYLTENENTVAWASATGYVPVRTSALESEQWQSFIKEHPEQAAASQQFDAAYNAPHVNGYEPMLSDVSAEIEAVLLGQTSVDEGLAAAEAAAKEKLKP